MESERTLGSVIHLDLIWSGKDVQLEQTEEMDLVCKVCSCVFIYSTEQISSTALNESIFKFVVFFFLNLAKESNKN